MPSRTFDEIHEKLKSSLFWAQARFRKEQERSKILEARATAMFAIILASLGILIGIIVSIIIQISTAKEMEILVEADFLLFATMLAIVSIVGFLLYGLISAYSAANVSSTISDVPYNSEGIDLEDALKKHIAWTNLSHAQENKLNDIKFSYLRWAMKLIFASVFLFITLSLCHILIFRIELAKANVLRETSAMELIFSFVLVIGSSLSYFWVAREVSRLSKQVSKIYISLARMYAPEKRR